MWPFRQSTLSSTALSSGVCLRCSSVSDCSRQDAASSAASFTSIPSESAAIAESLWVLMAASGCVYVTVCVCLSACVSVCVCVSVCNVFVCESVTRLDAFSYVAACWTRWAALSHTECLCRVWALRPACTGWTTSPLRSHRKI